MHLPRRTCLGLFAAAALSLSFVAGAQPLVGKDGWLFTPYEFAVPSDAADTQVSIGLFTQANKAFAAKGITLALAIVPSKIRVAPEVLPDDKTIDGYTAGKYQKAVAELRAGGVAVVDLEKAFLNSPDRLSETPLFLRQDTHWSPKGAELAAQTIKAAVLTEPRLKAAYDQTPAAQFDLHWATNRVSTRARDLVRLLPRADAVKYTPEQVLPFKVTKQSAGAASLTGADEAVGILAIGSSYTNKNTGYPDALRFALQRELLDLSLNVDYGPWYGMLSYLQSDAYKKAPPKLIIWEIPERELRSPPNYKYRHAQYVMDNSAWLTQFQAALQ